MKSNKALLAVLILFVFTIFAFGCSSPADTAPSEPSPSLPASETSLRVVASTSWTAFMAEAAGAAQVQIIAPVELKHPPEYDFKPNDLLDVQNAELIVMAGYEAFMKKMIEAGGISEDKIFTVTTVNTFENLKEQTRAIAAELGTESSQQAWEETFTSMSEGILDRAQTQEVSSQRVLVHVHHQAFVSSLGFDVVGVFGAEELSPAKMGELAALKPDFIIDNFHNPQGITLAELAGVERVELRNFPGPEHDSLIALIMDNAQKLGLN